MSDSHPTVSEKQLAANRANACQSTGPRTSEGKSRSARNARKHGFSAAGLAIHGVEDPQELLDLRDDIFDAWRPLNSQEAFALERAALAQLQILRASRFDAAQFYHSKNAPELPAALLANIRAFQWSIPRDSRFNLLLRYQAQAERMYRRAIDDFIRLRKLSETGACSPQSLSPNEPISDTQVKQNTEVSFPETEPEQPEAEQAPSPAEAEVEQAEAEVEQAEVDQALPPVNPAVEAPSAPQQPVEAPKRTIPFPPRTRYHYSNSDPPRRI